MNKANESMSAIADPQWQVWVCEPLNKEADILLKWSRTSFFGGSPTSEPMVIDGRIFILFQRCGDEWTVKYALSTAISNYRFVMLIRNGKEIPLEHYLKEVERSSGGILGDAASMGRSGGMC